MGLKIKQIDGLQTQIDGRAAVNHNHAAGDVTSGTFAAARIPSLDAGKITSGIFATGRIPNLSAGKITSGTLNVARIPMLEISQIDGLQTALEQTNRIVVGDNEGDPLLGLVSIEWNGAELIIDFEDGQMVIPIR